MFNVNEHIDRYSKAREDLTREQYSEAEFARGQALAYLWGRADQGGLTMKPDVLDSFSWAYATMAALFAAGKVRVRRPLRDSWESFAEFGEIRDYDGKAIDREGTI